MDEVVGTKTPDLVSGRDLDLVTVTGANVVPGKWGNAFRFNGASSRYLKRTSGPADQLPINKHPALTVSLWARGMEPSRTTVTVAVTKTVVGESGINARGGNGLAQIVLFDDFYLSKSGLTATFLPPQPVAGIDHAAYHTTTLRGRVGAAWEQRADEFQMRVSVPPNASATAWLPAPEGADIRERGKPAREAEGVQQWLRRESDCEVWAMASGEYDFSVRKP